MPYYAKQNTERLIEKLKDKTDARSKDEIKIYKYVLNRMKNLGVDGIQIPSPVINKVRTGREIVDPKDK